MKNKVERLYESIQSDEAHAILVRDKDGDCALDDVSNIMDIYDVDIFSKRRPNGLVSVRKFDSMFPEVLNGTVTYDPHKDGTYSMDFSYDDPARGIAFEYLRERFFEGDDAEKSIGKLLEAYEDMGLVSEDETASVKNAYKNYTGHDMIEDSGLNMCEADQEFVSSLDEWK